ncbi:MAG: PQQ-binding-like beta-propeller repeat protein [Planctomycetes bacterium]|nr:PQQ-binding-like beta-propeller repeat protein [Planctomycetota bacterium]
MIRRCFALTWLVWSGWTASLGAEWPQWRGPNRDGVAAGAALPATWPERLPVLWETAAGPGYSTPVVAAGRIFFMERAGGDEVYRALDADTGKEIWRHAYPAPYEVRREAARHGDAPKSTVTVADGRVFGFGISGILTALAAADGKRLWRRDLGTEFASVPTFGAAASPLVAEGLVILPVGDADSGGALMAFRAADGTTAWRSVRDGPSYSSPIVADLAGIRQVISFTAKHVAGVALADGAELWTYPFVVPWDETIVTPIIWKDRVIVAGRDKGGTRMLRPRRDGDRVAIDEIWACEAPVYMSTPVIAGGAYFALEHKTGKLFCLTLDDGALAWKTGDFGDYASLVVAGDRILILDAGGRLTVIEATAKAYREIASIRASDAAVWAHLAVAGSRLYIRDAARILCSDLRRIAAKIKVVPT